MTLWAGLLTTHFWSAVLIALVLTHGTIVAVTLYLHRHQAHRALDLHPVLAHVFRFWLWLTTGMVTLEWVAVHRKHHARCETAEDPHSPQFLGIKRLLAGGVLLYSKASRDDATLQRYGQGTPSDRIERLLYSRYPVAGVLLLGLLDILLFGVRNGGLIYGIQMAWIPLWGAGVVNGLGHFWGYRNFALPNASTNLVPWGVLIGGEELHNNHHAAPWSPKLSAAPFEFDIGWSYIRMLAALGLARVRNPDAIPPRELAEAGCDAGMRPPGVPPIPRGIPRYGRVPGAAWRAGSGSTADRPDPRPGSAAAGTTRPFSDEDPRPVRAGASAPLRALECAPGAPAPPTRPGHPG